MYRLLEKLVIVVLVDRLTNKHKFREPENLIEYF